MAGKKKAVAAKKLGPEELDQRDRLQRLEKATGHDTSAAFAEMIEIERRRWYNFLNGLPLSHDVAVRLVQRVPGLTLDWLYFGNSGGLSLELARRLGVFDPPGKRSS